MPWRRLSSEAPGQCGDGRRRDCADAPWRGRLGKWNVCSERERWLRGGMPAASWGGTRGSRGAITSAHGEAALPPPMEGVPVARLPPWCCCGVRFSSSGAEAVAAAQCGSDPVSLMTDNVEPVSCSGFCLTSLLKLVPFFKVWPWRGFCVLPSTCSSHSGAARPRCASL